MKKQNLKKAVAISYKQEFHAPKVVAKGEGLIAEKIIEKAKESEVKIYEDESLVEELSKVDLGLNIPPELYEAVAGVLVFVNDLDKQEQFKKYGIK